VCTENSVRIDLATESLNVRNDGRAVMLFPTLFTSPCVGLMRLPRSSKIRPVRMAGEEADKQIVTGS
jgi:hypothetical protein